LSIFVFHHTNADELVPATLKYDSGKLVVLDQSARRLRLMEYKKAPPESSGGAMEVS
jgi:hypothetical protein